jgi:hypothetical protein
LLQSAVSNLITEKTRMKALFGLLGIVVLGVTGFAGGNTQKIEGYLMDVACARENSEKPKPGFAARHDKECLQMAECAESGYSIVTADKKVIKFDAKGNETAKKLLAERKKPKDFKASATGTLEGDTLKVESLTLEN